MGITNLLVYLRPLVENVSLERYRGETVAVDAMCWMHRGAVAAATELLLKGIPGPRFVAFVMKMVKMLLSYGIRPVLVFDGGKLPVKDAEDRARKAKREAAAKEARSLLATGVSSSDKRVRGKIVEAIRVTEDMIQRVMQALRTHGIEFIVAPYEADAQLAYLCRAGFVSAVISEDSDLLVYGCPRVIFKVNAVGEGQEINLANIPFLSLSEATSSLKSVESENVPPDVPDDPTATAFFETVDKTCARTDEDTLTDVALNNSPNAAALKALVAELKCLSFSMFVAMCVLSGSDYTSDVHVPGLGLKSAYTLIYRYKTLSGVFEFFTRDTKWKKKVAQVSARSSCAGLDGIADEQRVHIKHLVAQFVFENHYVYNPLVKGIVPIRSAEPAKTPLPNFDVISPSFVTFLNWNVAASALLGPVEHDGGRPLWNHFIATVDDHHMVARWKLTRKTPEKTCANPFNETTQENKEVQVAESQADTFHTLRTAKRTSPAVSGGIAKRSRPLEHHRLSADHHRTPSQAVFDVDQFVMEVTDAKSVVVDDQDSSKRLFPKLPTLSHEGLRRQGNVCNVLELLTTKDSSMTSSRPRSVPLLDAFKPAQRPVAPLIGDTTLLSKAGASSRSSASRRVDLMARASSQTR